MSLPLAGVRVLDLSRILAGPFAAQLLADLGADVVKVEPPGGDPTRQWGPPFDPQDSATSAYFRCANRGKRSIELDLHAAPDRARLDGLLARADVVVENFLPRSARRLGLGWTDLHPRFPRLVLASVRAFAADTDAAERPGYDFLLQAESGWMSITGPVGGPPMKVGVALVDVLAGLYLANGIQAALRQRDRTGVGLPVEVPLMEAALAGLVNVGAATLMTGEAPRRHGNAHPNIVPYETFACRDGDLALAVGNDRAFAALLAALGAGDALRVHPRWATNPGRVADRERVVATLAERFGTRTVAESLALCTAADVAAGPVRDVADVLFHQRGTLHRAICRQQDGDTGAVVETLGTPLLVDGRRVASPLPPPRRPADDGGFPD